MRRADAIELLASTILEVRRLHPVRVGIDGVDAAGKTTLADELVEPLEVSGRPVVRASIDGFHRPRERRYRQGRDSPLGYYEDSFDEEALLRSLLLPLGPGGDRRFRRRVFDVRADAPVAAPEERAEAGAILVFDGVFLQRPRLRDHWDLAVYVDAAFETTLERARVRDAGLLGSADEVETGYRRRYIPGQRIYLERCSPRKSADVLVRNDDPTRPSVEVRADDLAARSAGGPGNGEHR